MASGSCSRSKAITPGFFVTSGSSPQCSSNWAIPLGSKVSHAEGEPAMAGGLLVNRDAERYLGISMQAPFALPGLRARPFEVTDAADARADCLRGRAGQPPGCAAFGAAFTDAGHVGDDVVQVLRRSLDDDAGLAAAPGRARILPVLSLT